MSLSRVKTSVCPFTNGNICKRTNNCRLTNNLSFCQFPRPDQWKEKREVQCSAKKFHNWGQCPRGFEKVGTFEKKWRHCGDIDATVIWRSKISFPSVYTINDHVLTINKQYKQTEVPLDFSEQGLCGRIICHSIFHSIYIYLKVHSQDLA